MVFESRKSVFGKKIKFILPSYFFLFPKPFFFKKFTFSSNFVSLPLQKQSSDRTPILVRSAVKCSRTILVQRPIVQGSLSELHKIPPGIQPFLIELHQIFYRIFIRFASDLRQNEKLFSRFSSDSRQIFIRFKYKLELRFRFRVRLTKFVGFSSDLYPTRTQIR